MDLAIQVTNNINMKFGIYKNSTLKPLDRLVKLVSNKSSLPILDCVRVELNSEGLSLTAGNDGTKMAITTEAIPMGDEVGGFCVDITTFQNVLRKMPDAGIGITLKDREVEIDFNSGKITLPVFPLEEYPSLSHMDGEAIFIDKTMSSNISKAFAMVADDELRPVLNGIYFDTKNGNIVSTDGHSLYLSSGLPISEGVSPFIMSGDASKALRGLREYSISADSRNVYIKGDDFEIISRQVEGVFPNYNAVIPNNEIDYFIDRETLLKSIDRSTLCVSEDTYLVVMELGNTSIHVTAEDRYSNKHFREELPCNGDGIGTVGLKGTLAALCLKMLDTDMICLSYASPSRAILFKPIDSKSGLRELVLLMPMDIG